MREIAAGSERVEAQERKLHEATEKVVRRQPLHNLVRAGMTMASVREDVKELLRASVTPKRESLPLVLPIK